MSKGKVKNSFCRSVTIVGFGNFLMSDDGVGIRVIEELEKSKYFKNVELVDGGTSGIDLIFHLQNSDKVILVDALDAGQKTGEIITITPDNVKEFKSNDIKSYSLHGFDLSEVLKLTSALGLNQKLTIVGIKPKNLDFGESLTPEIGEKIPDIVEAIKKELNKK